MLKEEKPIIAFTPEQVGMRARINTGDLPGAKEYKEGVREKMSPEKKKRFRKYNIVASLKKANARLLTLTERLNIIEKDTNPYAYNKALSMIRGAEKRLDRLNNEMDLLNE